MNSVADHAKGPILKNTLQRLAQDRDAIASELGGLVRSLGGDPDKSGTVLGAMHRGWMSMKEAASIADDRSLIEQCERGEDEAVKEFREALAKPLPSGAQAMVIDCFQQVQRSRDQIRRLRDAPPTPASPGTI